MEKRNKFKILKRILPIISAVLVTAAALTTPIMAIVDSSEGTNQNYDITARSTFPMTVGLAFELDEGNNVTFASDIGGYGQEFNTTQGGTDTFFWTSNASTASQLEGQLEYEFLDTRVQDKEYRNSFPLMTNYGFSKASYRPIRITTKAGSDLTNGKDCSSVVYRMSDVVINSTAIRVGNYFSNLQEDYEGDIDIGSAESIRNANAYRPSADDYQYLVPHVVLPDISTTAGYYGRYNVIATITDEWGKQWDLNYSIPIDTRGATTDTLVPFLPMSIFDSYGKTKGDMAYNIGMSNTVVLNDYYGYLDVDYYEFTSTLPDISTIDVWVQFRNGTLTLQEQFMLTDYVGQTFGTWLADNIDLGDNFYADSSSEGIEITYTYGDDEYKGFITDGTDNVTSLTVIQGGVTYTCYCEYDFPIDTSDPIGTWFFNETLTPYYTDTSSNAFDTVYLNYDVAYDSDTYDSIYFEYIRNAYNRMRYESATTVGFKLVYDFNTNTWGSYDEYGDEVRYIFINSIPDRENPYLEKFTTWLSANAEKISNSVETGSVEASTASVMTLSDEPTAIADDGEWVKVEGTEYGRSATLTLPLWDTSNWTNTNNADYKTYSFPTVQKFLTDVQNSTNIPTDIQQDYTSWIGTATAGFLNMELMPNFSIGGVLAILIGFSIVMLFLKYFAGG